MPYLVVPGLALLVSGFALIGAAVLRSRVLPAWVSVLLLLGDLEDDMHTFHTAPIWPR